VQLTVPGQVMIEVAGSHTPKAAEPFPQLARVLVYGRCVAEGRLRCAGDWMHGNEGQAQAARAAAECRTWSCGADYSARRFQFGFEEAAYVGCKKEADTRVGATDGAVVPAEGEHHAGARHAAGVCAHAPASLAGGFGREPTTALVG
jgi:hypothetical protein